MPGIVRRRIKKPGHELSLIPLMSLFLMLIPMLLLTAEFERAAVLDLFLPSSDLNAGAGMKEGPQLNLTISVNPKRLQILANGKKISIPSIREGDTRAVDLQRLGKELYRLKKKFPDAEEVVLLIDGDIRYESIIDIMDASRELHLPGGKVVPLFPNVALADRAGIMNGADNGK